MELLLGLLSFSLPRPGHIIVPSTFPGQVGSRSLATIRRSRLLEPLHALSREQARVTM